MNVRPKKKLGQHFLNDKNIAENIVDAMPLTLVDKVIEIGPGMGVLTDFIVKKWTIPFEAIEIDTESLAYLAEKYTSDELAISETDALKYNFEEGVKYGIIGNFPYNISSQILFQVYENKDKVRAVVGMFQKEVATRIASKPGNRDYGILSVLLQAYYHIDYLFTVDEHVFNPPPKVKSGVIRLVRNERQNLPCDEVLFKKIIKLSFNQRRKMLRNSLSSVLNENVDTWFLDKRPETLSSEDFIRLTQMLSK